MKTLNGGFGRLFLVAASMVVIAGCSASQQPMSSVGSAALPAHIRAATDSTQVYVENSWTATISGTTSASSCWRISSLPIVAAGDTDGPVSITYNASTICGIPAGASVAYGPAAFSGPRCTFNIVFDVNFSYSVTQGTGTNCSIKYPPMASAIFDYAQLTPARTRSHNSTAL